MTKQPLIRSLETATLTAVAVVALLSSSAPARADDVTCTDNAATVACTSAPNYLDGLVSSDAVGVTLNSGTIAPVNQFGVLTQSQGSTPGGAGNDATAINNGTITGSGSSGGGMSVVSFGGDGDGDNAAGAAGTASAINNGVITNSGDNVVGIRAASQGGSVSFGGLFGATNGGNAGSVFVTNNLSITTDGNAASAVSAAAQGGNAFSFGGSVGNGGTVDIDNTGSLTTLGTNSAVINALSTGGTGFGTGGIGGNIFVTNDHGATITASGVGSAGIFARTIGADGSAAGSGGLISIENDGTIKTFGDSTSSASAGGIVAFSVGGRGYDGASCDDCSAGDGSQAGNGGLITLTNTGTIKTTGLGAAGMLGVSAGGGGGNGGSAGGAGGTGGSGGPGGVGGAVSLFNNGTITTTNDSAAGMVAQSLGGSGGAGGNSSGFFYAAGGSGSNSGMGGMASAENAGSIVTNSTNSAGVIAQSIGGFAGAGGSGGGFSIYGGGGGGAAGGNGGTVLVTGDAGGSILTTSDGSFGILAQSIGGGGGSGGDGSGLFGNGSGASSGGSGGAVTVNNANAITTFGNLILANGNSSTGILAQSIGGGGGNGGSGGGLVGFGGDGGTTSGGGVVTVTNSGAVTTHGDGSLAIEAQSIGGGGGNGGSAGGLFSLGGQGGGGGQGGIVTLTNSGNLKTTGNDADAIEAQSIGGGGGNGGGAGSVSVGLSVAVGGQGGKGGDGDTVTVTNNASSIITTGDRSRGVYAQSIGGGGGTGGFAVSVAVGEDAAIAIGVGGAGGDGGKGGSVTVNNNGAITTGGLLAQGVEAQSIGGGGGDGGFSVAVSASAGLSGSLAVGGAAGGGGDAMDVTLNNSGKITTGGYGALGIDAQSIGGGGGNGGLAVSGAMSIEGGPVAALGFGGSGGSGGDANTVTLTNTGSISTTGDTAHAIVAQSIGGGGGTGGLSIAGTLADDTASLALSFGGKGGPGGDAMGVTVTNSATGTGISTTGMHADGIVAQSIGGGGGDGGFSVAGGISGDSAMDFGFGGKGNVGGVGSTVTVDSSSTIHTSGAASDAILAQSIGGGGGDGGFAIAGGLSGQGAGLDFAMGGSGANGATADTVTVTNSGAIRTQGVSSNGIEAQSIGGGGGAGGFAGTLAGGFGDGAQVSVALGGNGSTGGDAGIVSTTNHGTITTTGVSADAIIAQSIGGGGGNGGFSLATAFGIGEDAVNMSVALGGKGGAGGLGNEVDVTNTGVLHTAGDHSYGILAQSIGGGGGNGGFAATGTLATDPGSKQASVTLGGDGGPGSQGGKVDVQNTNGIIITTGNAADAILAQSIGGGGGNGGLAFAGSFSGTDAKSLSLALGGNGGTGGFGGEVDATNNAAILTQGDNAIGIEAQSIGGGGGNGGLSIAASVGGGATDADKSTTSMAVSVGGTGGSGNVGGTVNLTNNGTIITSGDQADGVEAQSIGGGGGSGGASLAGSVILGANQDGANNSVAIAVGGKGGSGNIGGTVNVIQTGTIFTSGGGADAIYAQSVGGGGGSGGASRAFSQLLGDACPGDNPDCDAKNKQFNLSLGGNGGSANNGGDVHVTNSGTLITMADDADGIFAQSVGGGGGTGGNGHLGSIVTPPPGTVSRSKFLKTLTIAVGGSAGASGDGGLVDVENTSNISTSGATAYGIFAQSVGGGGGAGGDGDVGVLGRVGIGGSGGASGNGGTVIVNQTGNITTTGQGATAIFAQSVGGGGGTAGNIDAGLAHDMSELGVTVPGVNIGLGLTFAQPGGSGGNGGDVTVNANGAIATYGLGADGIFAQSVGGGGGAAGNLGNTIGTGFQQLGWTGSVGGIGDGGTVTVTQSGSDVVSGDYSDAIYAQSAGGSAGPGNIIGKGGDVSVTADGLVEAKGFDGVGIFAQSVGLNGDGNLTVTIGANGQVYGGTGPDAAGIFLADGATHTITNAGIVGSLDGLSGFAIVSQLGGTQITNTGDIIGSIALSPFANTIANNNGVILLGNYTNNALSSLTNNGANAFIDVAAGYTLDNQSALANGFVNNGGLVAVDQGGTVATGNGQGVYLQNGGSTVVDGSWTQALTDIEGGQLSGIGTVNGLVYNNANPGNAPANTGNNAGVFGNVSGSSNLTFTGLVTGTGNYGGTVTFDGALSPGDVTAAAANPNAGGTIAGFPTTQFYPQGTGSVATIHGGTMIFGASDDLFMDIAGTNTDKIIADNVVLGGTLTVVPTGTLEAGSYDLVTASGQGNGISGDFALAQMLNLGNGSDLYLTTSKNAGAYTATLRSTLADYGVAVDGTLSQIGGDGQTEQAPGQSVTAFLETSFSSAALATGGNGHNDGPGGNGGAGVVTDIVNGSGNSLAVGTGGNGGFGTGNAPNGFGGNGGVGVAVAQMNGATGTANAFATGGNGGAALGNDVGGKGGDSLAQSLALNATGAVAANATSTGGAGGNSAFGAGGKGGDATAIAAAITTGGPANATARATGGASGLGLIFTPVGGGAANATAVAAGTSGLATAIAATPGNTPLFAVNAQATGTVAAGNITSVNAATNAGGAFPQPVAPFNNAAPNNAFATAVGLPDRASLNTALTTDPNNFAKFSPLSTFVAGEGLLGAVAPGGIAHSFDTKVDFTFMIPSGYGSTLTVGLLNGTAFNAAAFDPSHDSLTLTITDNANVIFSDSFLSLTDAVNFFTDDVLTLGTIFGAVNDIGIDLLLVSSDNVGFQGNIVVGTVPEPASWLLFGTGLVLLIVYRRRPRRVSAAA